MENLCHALRNHPLVVISRLHGGKLAMFAQIRLAKLCGKKILILTALATALAAACMFTPATAESPSDPKKVAFEVVDRNAEQIATLGDVIYYYGEPGMQEYETSK